MNKAIYISNFLKCDANNVLLEYSGKKYCTDVDLSENTNWPLSSFCQKDWDVLLVPDLKRTPVHVKGCVLLLAPHTEFL